MADDINLVDVIQITLSVMAQFSASGDMLRKGVDFFDTAHEIIIDYNTAGVPHIIYQEAGFTHWMSKKFIDHNQGFISEKTVGQLTTYGWSKTLNIEFNMLENNQTLLEDRNKMLEEIGATYRI